MPTIALEFHVGASHDSEPVLSRVVFCDVDGAEPRVSVRGKTGGPLFHHGTFQWTKAVKGLSVLLLRAAARGRSSDLHGEALLCGGGGTLASSLTYAIDKEPCWLTEMFGSNLVGLPFCKRLFLRNNPALRMGAPVTLGLNNRLVRNDQVHVTVNGEAVECASALYELSEAISGETFRSLVSNSKEVFDNLSQVA